MTKPPQKAPALPFKVYTVYSNGFRDGPELQSATVVRITATKWWYDRSGELGFQCRTGCEPFLYPTTPQEAWQRFRDLAQEAVNDAEAERAVADRELMKLRNK